MDREESTERYVVPCYQAGEGEAWFHFLHGNVPGHEIDFLYRPEVPQGALGRQHYSHVLRLVRYIAHRVAVMYLGRIVEAGPTEEVFTDPRHPYTAALMAAAPSLEVAEREVMEAVTGELPSPLSIPPGCPFHPRCPRAVDRCRSVPPTDWRRGEHRAACHLAGD